MGSHAFSNITIELIYGHQAGVEELLGRWEGAADWEPICWNQVQNRNNKKK